MLSRIDLYNHTARVRSKPLDNRLIMHAVERLFAWNLGDKNIRSDPQIHGSLFCINYSDLMYVKINVLKDKLNIFFSSTQ